MVRLISLLGIKQKINQKKIVRTGDIPAVQTFQGIDIHTLIWDCLYDIYISARLCSGW